MKLKVFSSVAIACMMFISSLSSAAITPITLPASAFEDQAIDSGLDLNKATVKELVALKGMSNARAKAIVAYRKQHGGFKAVYELSKLKAFKSIKPTQLKEIQDQLRIG